MLCRRRNWNLLPIRRFVMGPDDDFESHVLFSAYLRRNTCGFRSGGNLSRSGLGDDVGRDHGFRKVAPGSKSLDV